jgi:predicted DCC family thiol-disulfide oxidoreductase YuxK
MKRLYVLFDGHCRLCGRCRYWLEKQPAYIELRFIPLQSADIHRRFPGIEQLDLEVELVVVSDEGAVYQGPQAWIMCLYALKNYRAWAQRLTHPALLPWARRVCELVSTNRLGFSGWFLTTAPESAGKRLSAEPPPLCREDNCHV